MSPRFSLSKSDWLKISKGLMLALAGALLAWVLTELVPTLEASSDPRLLFIAAVLSAVVNVIRKWITDTR